MSKRMTTGYGLQTMTRRITDERNELEKMIVDGRIDKAEGEAMIKYLTRACRSAYRARDKGYW